jgi:hypothetical protein
LQPYRVRLSTNNGDKDMKKIHASLFMKKNNFLKDAVFMPSFHGRQAHGSLIWQSGSPKDLNVNNPLQA